MFTFLFICMCLLLTLCFLGMIVAFGLFVIDLFIGGLWFISLPLGLIGLLFAAGTVWFIISMWRLYL